MLESHVSYEYQIFGFQPKIVKKCMKIYTSIRTQSKYGRGFGIIG
jgi:hypothetical protein